MEDGEAFENLNRGHKAVKRDWKQNYETFGSVEVKTCNISLEKIEVPLRQNAKEH